MLCLGLCCSFRDQPIKFRTTTAAAIGRMSRTDGLAKHSTLCLANADALLSALQYCAANGIGCFRIVSQFLPLKTHPQLGYKVDELPDATKILNDFGRAASSRDSMTYAPAFIPTSLWCSTRAARKSWSHRCSKSNIRTRSPNGWALT